MIQLAKYFESPVVTKPVRLVGSGLVAVLSLLLMWPYSGHAQKEVDTTPEVGGYIQFHFNQPIHGPDGRFRLQRTRLSVEGKASERISYEMDIDPRSPDHTGLLRDAFFNVELTPNTRLRVGQHKAKFGYINQRSSSRLYTVNRPELANTLSRGLNLRDIGVTLSGKRPMADERAFEYAISVVNGAGRNVSRDTNGAKNVSGRIGLRRGRRAATKWRLGLSGSRGDLFRLWKNPDDGPGKGYHRHFTRMGTDFLLDHSRFRLNGEFAIGREENQGAKKTVQGYYLTWVGKTDRTFGPVVRYDSMDHTDYRRVTVGAYHGAPSDDFRILLNYELIDTPAEGKFYVWTLVRI